VNVPYRLALELGHVRRICREDEALAQQVTALIVSNKEFRAHIMGPAAEAALPSILQLFRSAEGLHGLLEFYAGAPPPEGTRVVRVGSVSQWHEALEAAGERPVVALFATSGNIGCRLLAPTFNRVPNADGLDGVDFVKVDLQPDDGLAQQVFDEAFVSAAAAPCFVFLRGCLELRKWRYEGADIGQLVKRIKRIQADDRLEDGPDAE